MFRRPWLAFALLALSAGCLSLAGLDGDYREGELGETVATSVAQSSVSAGGADTGSGGTTSAGGSGGGAIDPPRGWVVVDTLTVPVDGSAVTSRFLLERGVTYLLRASGTFIISRGQGTQADAEYYDLSDPPGSLHDGGAYVDMGLAVDDPVMDLNRTPDWGPYQPSHVYEVDFVGKGATISANYHDEVTYNNVGTLTLEILAFQ